MDDWVSLENMDLSTVEPPGFEVDVNGNKCADTVICLPACDYLLNQQF